MEEQIPLTLSAPEAEQVATQPTEAQPTPQPAEPAEAQPAAAPPQAEPEMLQFGYRQSEEDQSIIKVVGVGGGGGNAVQHMYRDDLIHDVSYLVINTDKQALKHNTVPFKLAIAELGAGSKPEVARRYAEEHAEAIRTALSDGTRMVFITAGMGGGTGTGAAPVVARIAQELDILTVGIVTIPFSFEGRDKMEMAFAGVDEMRQHVDALLVVNNDKLINIYPDLEFFNAMDLADDTLAFAAKSISDIINEHAHINLDFADVMTTLKGSGVALISSGKAKGERRVTKAIQQAISSPLLLDNDISQAKHLLFELCFSPTHPAKMHEIGELKEFIGRINPNIRVIWGAMKDDSLDEEVKIILLASGFEFEGGNVIATQSTAADAARADEEARRKVADEEARRKAEEREARARAAAEEQQKKVQQAREALKKLQEANQTFVDFGMEPRPITPEICEILGLDAAAAARLMLPEKDAPDTAPEQPQVAATAPEQPQVTAAAPEQPQVAAAPEQPQVAAAAPEQPQVIVTAPEQPQVAAAFKQPQVATTAPEQPHDGDEKSSGPHRPTTPAGGIQPAASLADGIERIRRYYGDEVANQARMDEVRGNYFIFDDEDLSNDELIAELERRPAYQRTPEDLVHIRAHRRTPGGASPARGATPDGSIHFE